jgi:hypothetical protein
VVLCIGKMKKLTKPSFEGCQYVSYYQNAVSTGGHVFCSTRVQNRTWISRTRILGLETALLTDPENSRTWVAIVQCFYYVSFLMFRGHLDARKLIDLDSPHA